MGDTKSASSSKPIDQNLLKEIANTISKDLETTFLPEECIYKAPAALRDLNRAAYTPRVISIGPIHHGNEKLKPMEIQKQRYLKEFCKRLQVQTEKQEEFLEGLLSIIGRTSEDDKNEIHRCYAANAFKLCSAKKHRCYAANARELCSAWFPKMILMDAVFIFELFWRNKEYMDDRTRHKHQDDFIIGKPWLRGAIQRDLILLENQLPFFILEKLYTHATRAAYSSKDNYPSFLELSCCCFEKYHKRKDKNNDAPTDVSKANCRCFLKLSCCYFEKYHKGKDKKNDAPKNNDAPTDVSKANYLCSLKLSCCYFEKYGETKDKTNDAPTEVLHFTDLVRYFLSFKHPEVKSPDEEMRKNLCSATMLKPSPKECLLNIEAWNCGKGNPVKKGEERRKHLYNAKKLHQAGIKFKPSPEECLLYIEAWNSGEGNRVKKGELHMPPLEIDNSTECLFRNLMALEQCHYPRKEYICRYVKLLDYLVDVEKDVDLLIENKVIVSRLGDSKAVTRLINRLCLEIEIEDEVRSGYDTLHELLINYYESSWNKNKAYLVSVYFKNVWIGTGTVIGLIVLAITVARFILYFFR